MTVPSLPPPTVLAPASPLTELMSTCHDQVDQTGGAKDPSCQVSPVLSPRMPGAQPNRWPGANRQTRIKIAPKQQSSIGPPGLTRRTAMDAPIDIFMFQRCVL